MKHFHRINGEYRDVEKDLQSTKDYIADNVGVFLNEPEFSRLLSEITESYAEKTKADALATSEDRVIFIALHTFAMLVSQEKIMKLKELRGDC